MQLIVLFYDFSNDIPPNSIKLKVINAHAFIVYCNARGMALAK